MGWVKWEVEGRINVVQDGASTSFTGRRKSKGTKLLIS